MKNFVPYFSELAEFFSERLHFKMNSSIKDEKWNPVFTWELNIKYIIKFYQVCHFIQVCSSTSVNA